MIGFGFFSQCLVSSVALAVRMEFVFLGWLSFVLASWILLVGLGFMYDMLIKFKKTELGFVECYLCTGRMNWVCILG